MTVVNDYFIKLKYVFPSAPSSNIALCYGHLAVRLSRDTLVNNVDVY